MATFQIWRGDEGDARPGERLASVTIDTTQPKPAVKIELAALRTQAEAYHREGSYVVARNADTGRLVVSLGNVPAVIEYDKRVRTSGFRVDVAALGGDAVPRDAWFDIRDLQLRINAAGTLAELRFKHREDDRS